MTYLTQLDTDFWCLARNVLLLTLLSDDEAGNFTSNIWEIFYHFYLDKASLDLLSDQCQKLVDLAESLEVWNQSKYGAFLRFCTHATLLELRGYWGRYLRTDVSRQGKQRLQTQFQSGMNKAAAKASEDIVVYNACRSAVPLWQEIGKIAPNHFKSYWKSGVTCTPSVASAPLSPHLNPTFVHSSKGQIFNVHYGTDPIISFHLAATTSTVSGNHNRMLTAETVVIGRSCSLKSGRIPSGDRWRGPPSLCAFSPETPFISAMHFIIYRAQGIVLPGYTYLLGEERR